RTVSFYGSLVNVNAYHQPGVEAGKKMASSVLSLQTEVQKVIENSIGTLDIPTLATKAGAPDAVETVYKIVRHLAANGRGIILEGNMGDPSTLKVSVG
ncbi:MAG: glucose-6-phosphate isomerase, partial [cyanobacterium endosymbiont of Rhopalodia yunnanensis]